MNIAGSLNALPSGSPVTEVARRLLDLFTGGDLAPGTRLPPERQLAATLEVGRSAVREALAALEILGIVDVRPGSGTYLRGAASDLLPQALRWGLLIGERNTSELIELRSGLEIYVARLAAARADERAIAALTTALEAMRSSRHDFAAFAVADSRFHHVLSESAANGTIVDMLHVVRSLLQVYSDRAVHDTESVLIAIEEHAAVLEAIAAADENASASAMANHMSTATRRLSGQPLSD
ncbi:MULTISPECIES: FCD domain-containing protein [unclassified Microbacterium]|uniref:FadR/GntR family transcriptional regulator n=1 Tax=unclassified Microbacterium TaxID=2609290 RepID=UPI0027DFAE35|nr:MULTISPECIES: FCD domain-containing protein [unclassified Microbacterium]